MPLNYSPLRYPGGKAQLTNLVIELLGKNDLFYGAYVEPCAGGAGIAWRLLLHNYVTEVFINDIDPSIYAFWSCVFNQTDDLCQRIDSAKVTVREWRRQRAVQDQSRPRIFDLGFSTFFLNRTNRSGIIRGGVIGGLDQTGNYDIDCRFNKSDLIHRIQRIARHRKQVKVSRIDAAKFLETSLRQVPKRAFVNLDPPYFEKGPELYRNHYTPRDHKVLATALKSVQQKWMVTYDDTPETRKLYAQYPSFSNKLTYSAQVKRSGNELLVLDPRLWPPVSLRRLIGTGLATV